MIYECGEKPIGRAWYNFNPRFYLIALVFVIFEVEIAFMYPVASVYKSFIEKGQGLLAFGEIAEGEQRSEEHTSELQSHVNLVCRLLLEKKKKKQNRV